MQTALGALDAAGQTPENYALGEFRVDEGRLGRLAGMNPPVEMRRQTAALLAGLKETVHSVMTQQKPKGTAQQRMVEPARPKQRRNTMVQ